MNQDCTPTIDQLYKGLHPVYVHTIKVVVMKLLAVTYINSGAGAK